VLQCWRAEGHNLEAVDRQTARQGAEVLAYEALIDQALYPATMRYLWLDDKNYDGVTYRAVAPQLPFPFSFIRFVFVPPPPHTHTHTVTHSTPHPTDAMQVG